MKSKLLLSVVAATLVFALSGWADHHMYPGMMKKAVGVCKALKESIDASDAAAIKSNATELAAAFEPIEQFWAKRGANDAVEFAKNVQAAAHDIAGSGAAGAQDKFKNLTSNCGGCHNAHREKDADGNWKIK